MNFVIHRHNLLSIKSTIFGWVHQLVSAGFACWTVWAFTQGRRWKLEHGRFMGQAKNVDKLFLWNIMETRICHLDGRLSLEWKARVIDGGTF